MTSFRGRVLSFVWVLAVLGCIWPRVSFAWQETAVLGHRMRVRLESNSEAVVSHELLVKIRGGPVKSLPLAGVDPDAEILPDATVRMAQNTWNQWPLSVTSRPDGSLDLNIGAPKGLRGGTYLFAISYRTSFQGTERIVDSGDRLVVRWVGPRLPNGIDTVRLTFDLPRGAEAPSLPDAPVSAGALALFEQVRRGDRDEVDLVRAHVAGGEPTLWEVEVSRDVLNRPRESAVARAPGAPLPALARPALSRDWWIGIALGLLLAALGLGKARDLERRATTLGVRVRALVRVPAWLRALLSFGSFAASAFVAGTEEPAPAAGLLGVAILSGAYLAPIRAPRPRGPGDWRVVPEQTLEQLKPRERGWFDVSSLGGFALFLAIALSLSAGAYTTLPMSPYRALLLLAAVLPFVPLFLTGRLSDFPVSPLTEGRAWARFLRRELKTSGHRLTLWGRYPLESQNLAVAPIDEARLRLELRKRVPGLKTFEVAFEEGAGRFILPCVLLRVLEDSEARLRLKDLDGFVRGRDSAERVLIVRPPVPTPKELARLILDLTERLSQSEESKVEPSPPTRAARSGGKGDRTRKAGVSLDAT